MAKKKIRLGINGYGRIGRCEARKETLSVSSHELSFPSGTSQNILSHLASVLLRRYMSGFAKSYAWLTKNFTQDF